MQTRPVFVLNNTYLLFLPLLGIGSFLLLYVLAAFNYPGGSWIAPEHSGFSFWHNYLCDLLDVNAINGEPNKARLYAITGLGLLCAGIFSLWSLLPRLFETKSLNQKIMRISGFLSVLVILFLAMGNHDKIVRIAGVFGVIAFISCCIELLKASYKKLFLFGIVSILTFLTNYLIYESGIFIMALPVIQKITFIFFLGWFIGLDLALYQSLKHQPTKST